MRRLAITAALAFAVAGGAAIAQPAPDGAGADAANAASMPMQGTADIMAQASPMGAEPRAYPLCSRTITDECVNPREAGRNHGNRPLDYWPGRPAGQADQ